MQQSFLQKVWIALFFIAITSVILLESINILSRDDILNIILIATTILIVLAPILKIHIRIPIKLTILFTLFSIFAAISTMFSINPLFAFKHQLYYLSVFALSIIFYSIRFKTSKLLLGFLIGTSVISLVYSYVLPFISKDYLQPYHGYQLVFKYEYFLGHHPRGVLLLMLLIVVSYLAVTYKKVYLFGLLVGGLVLLGQTYMRAAFLSYATTVGLMLYQFRTKISKPIGIIIVFCCLSIVITGFLVTTYEKTHPVIGYLQSLMSLPDKPLLGVRDRYLMQSIEAIKIKPVTGYGSFNFIQASDTFEPNLFWRAFSSHNMFLDFFVENGIIGGMLMILIVGSMFWSGFKHLGKDIYTDILFYLFVALTIVFLLTYYHRVYSLFLIYICIGISLVQKNIGTSIK